MEDEFLERVHGIVQCTAATVDTKGRPRSRIWHPIWEGKTGRIANNPPPSRLGTSPATPTSRSAISTREIHGDPGRPVYVDYRVEWDDTAEGKRRTWEMYVRAP